MRNLRKLGILTLTTGLSIGILAPTVSANTPHHEQNNKLQIRVSSVESVVTKGELIEKFKKFFPNKFDFLNSDDFYMSTGHHYPEDNTIRYDLSFHKEINGKFVHGNVGFFGEELEIENFNYRPLNSADALFPAKVTKAEAEKTAIALLNKLANGSEYQLDDIHEYYPGNQPLTEPINYSFSFVRTENNLPVSDQQIRITVLGNGEITDFYRNLRNTGPHTYDDATKAIPMNEILEKVKENISIDLQYRVDFNHRTEDSNVQLVYQPTYDYIGVHALSGDWLIGNKFSSDLPEKKEIELITDVPLQPKHSDFSVEKAKAYAQELLAIDSDEVKLFIQSVDERKNYNGQEVIAIEYMYEYKNGGYGTSLELDKHTGEIIQYHDIKSEVLREISEKTKNVRSISNKEALNQAIKYLKEFTPSYLHNYAKPIGEAYFEEDRDSYYFTFPRVVDGIIVAGDSISAGVSADGSLLSLNVNYQNVENWPSSVGITSEEEAKAKFIEKLSLDLQYTKEGIGEDNDHYYLTYMPMFNGTMFSYLDANTNEWNSLVDKVREHQALTHPWAEEELNYLINAQILDIKDVNVFDANSLITKGDALSVIMKSLTRFYDDYYPGQENMSQSFENISPKHPLYQIVERAVSMGILDTEKETFDLDEHITREELSVWYIRALGLEQAAKNGNIYQLNFADANNVQDGNIGYVALASSLGLLTANHNLFYPKQEVTYAQIAVSVVRLAHEAYERNPDMYY